MVVQNTDERGHPVVPKPAGVDRRGNEFVSQSMHHQERSVAGNVAEIAGNPDGSWWIMRRGSSTFEPLRVRPSVIEVTSVLNKILWDYFTGKETGPNGNKRSRLGR